MPHGLILGPSECGKSTLARWLGKMDASQGRQLAAFARRDTQAWSSLCGAAVTSDPARLFKWYKDPRNKSVTFLIDDAGRVVGRHDPEWEATASEGRHDGHRFIYIAQAATMLNKNIRRNCKFLWTFKQSQEDADILAREFIHPELRLAVHLDRYEFLYCEKGFGPVKRGRAPQ